jgi:hypothetical protein
MVEMRVAAGRWTPKLVLVLVLASNLVSGTDFMSRHSLRRVRIRAMELAVQRGFGWAVNVQRPPHRLCGQLNLQLTVCPPST